VGLRAQSGFKQQGEDIVSARTAGQGQRLTGDIRANVAPRTDVHALDESLVNQLEQEALPMRDAALFERRVTPPVIPMELPAPVVEAPDEGLRRVLADAPPLGPLKPMDADFMARLAAKEEVPEVPVAAQPFGPPAPQIEPRVPRMVEDPALNRLLNEHPLGQKALQVATQTLNAERATRELQGIDASDLPEVLMGDQQDYRSLYYMKRFLDDQVHRL
jgi:hypothetical protein